MRCLTLGLLLSLAVGGCREVTEEPGQTSPVAAQVESLVSRCGLSGHMVYEVRGNELRILGVDPRLHHPRYDSCFLLGLEPLDVFFGFVGPQEQRFMGPPEARPSDEMLNEIEARLARGSCAKEVSRWWREYGFEWEQGRLNTRILHLALHENWPGAENPGRTIYDSHTGFVLSDAAGGTAFGTYDTVTKQLSLEHCGPNHRSLRPQIVP
jgi:hypothetical protein